MSSDAIALRLENLRKTYGRIKAVDGLSLEVRPGEMVGFLGPNGAGKSTTLFMIAGLVHPSGGTVEIFGLDIRKQFKEAMATVGTLVETSAFYPYLIARKNLELAARLRGRINRREIDQILEQVGLEQRQKDKVGTFSLGMRQRLGLGLALLGSPRLLLLDEPTNGLDPEATRDILTLLKEKVRREQMAVFLSSHLLYEVEEFCDRVVVINKGRLIAAGPVSEILASATSAGRPRTLKDYFLTVTGDPSDAR